MLRFKDFLYQNYSLLEGFSAEDKEKIDQITKRSKMEVIWKKQILSMNEWNPHKEHIRARLSDILQKKHGIDVKALRSRFEPLPLKKFRNKESIAYIVLPSYVNIDNSKHQKYAGGPGIEYLPHGQIFGEVISTNNASFHAYESFGLVAWVLSKNHSSARKDLKNMLIDMFTRGDITFDREDPSITKQKMRNLVRPGD